MKRLGTYEAQRQIVVLEKVIQDGPSPISELPTDVVASLVKVGLMEETDGGVAAAPAALHYHALLDAV
jgi:hypothetical protein